MPPFGIYPWLFLIPPLLIAVGGLAAFFFSRTELGKRRARYVRAKYGIVTGPEADAERKRLEEAREARAREAAAAGEAADDGAAAQDAASREEPRPAPK